LKKGVFLAHHKAAKKAIRQSARRRIRNRTYKTRIKTALKNFETAESAEDKAKAFVKAQQILDRSSRRHIITANFASRKVAKLARSLKETGAEAGA
jgi:small subunit ribosomal protein S20